jgi:hypothetical protein
VVEMQAPGRRWSLTLTEDRGQLDYQTDGGDGARITQILMSDDGLSYALRLRRLGPRLLTGLLGDHAAIELEAQPRCRDVLIRCANIVEQTGEEVCFRRY